MVKISLNRNAVKFGKSIEQPTMSEIKNTPSLWNASLEDALKYGGDLTKAAIGALDLKFDRKYIIVDTKIHMLMPNFYPAIPSWHTDGVPRGENLNPSFKGNPDIFAQEDMSDTRFHLLVTGEGCKTEFLKESNVEFEIPDTPSSDLYKMINKQISEGIENKKLNNYQVPSCTAVEFDWWTLHRGIQASKHEWRYLIRVTETDHMQPQTDLRQIIRTQQQVYVPSNFGW
jgi:hypothetical protein